MADIRIDAWVRMNVVIVALGLVLTRVSLCPTNWWAFLSLLRCTLLSIEILRLILEMIFSHPESHLSNKFRRLCLRVTPLADFALPLIMLMS